MSGQGATSLFDLRIFILDALTVMLQICAHRKRQVLLAEINEMKKIYKLTLQRQNTTSFATLQWQALGLISSFTNKISKLS